MKSPNLDTEFVSLLLAVLAAGLAIVSQVGPSNGASSTVENIALALVGASARGLGTSSNSNSEENNQVLQNKPKTRKPRASTLNSDLNSKI